MSRPTPTPHRSLRPAPAPALARRPRFAPAAEPLEARALLSTLKVGPGAAYPTIGAAVVAARPGDTIQVAPGTYREQVVIPAGKDGLTLVSQRPLAAVIQAPAAPTGRAAVVDVEGAHNVTVSGFTITGAGAAGALDEGVYVGGGGSATVSDSHITQVSGGGIGSGVHAGGADDFGSVIVVRDVIDGYEKDGVVVQNAASSARVADSIIIGSGPNDRVAQNGVQVSDAAAATIRHNVILNNQYAGPDPFSAAGVILYNPGVVVVDQNLVTANDIGIFLIGTTGAAVTHNVSSFNTVDGIDLDGSSSNVVSGNTTSNNGSGVSYTSPDQPDIGGDGIAIYDGSAGNTVDHNQSRDNVHAGIWVDATSAGNTLVQNMLKNNGVYDAEDDSSGSGTGGTANTWVRNKGRTDNRGGALVR